MGDNQCSRIRVHGKMVTDLSTYIDDDSASRVMG